MDILGAAKKLDTVRTVSLSLPGRAASAKYAPCAHPQLQRSGLKADIGPLFSPVDAIVPLRRARYYDAVARHEEQELVVAKVCPRRSTISLIGGGAS